MDGYRDPIFKGCTRPAMLAGVPEPCTVALLLSGVATLLAGARRPYVKRAHP